MKKTYRSIWWITFCFACILSLLINGYIFRNKIDAETIYTFRNEPDNTLDVLFLGSSHAYRFISPMLLWKYYGITSYNLGSSEQTLAQSYYLLKQALETQTPSVVVLDMYMLRIEKPYLSDARLHLTTDNMPFSPTKYIGINKMVNNTKDRIKFYIPFFSHHSRWSSLRLNDFLNIKDDYSKGAKFNYKIKSYDTINPIIKDEFLEFPDISNDYLNKIISLCTRKNIKLWALVTPYPKATENSQRQFNKLQEILKEKDIYYENLLEETDKLGIDSQSDYSDSNHVNMKGALKVTDYVGWKLITDFGVKNNKNNANNALMLDWEEKLMYYLEYLETEIYKQGADKADIFIPVLKSMDSYFKYAAKLN